MEAAREWAMAAVRVLFLFAPLLFSAVLSAFVIGRDLFPQWKTPIDAGRLCHGQRVFGDSKTWRGVVTAVAGCVLFTWMQCAAARYVPGWLAVVDYRDVSPVGFGTAMGAGAMAGELPNSFVKRRLGIAPGKTTRGRLRAVFWIWDQIDLLFGAWPLLLLWLRPPLRLVVASFAVALILHPLVAAIGFAVGARKSLR